jgi:hypothetical protein
MTVPNQGLITHPHATASRLVVQVNLPDSTPRLTLVVETDLFLNSTDPKHDPAAFDSLVDAIRIYLERRTEIERATINHIEID